MASFAVAAQQADTSRLPVVEGVTVRVTPGATAADVAEIAGRVQASLAAQLGGDWTTRLRGGGWIDATPTDPTHVPPLDRTWDAVRALVLVPGVDYAEPLLLVRLPDTQEVNARLGIWGVPYDDATEAAIAAASKPLDWSLKQMQVPEAWNLWHAARGDASQPGDGILIAHPDTGYRLHPQVAPILQGKGRDFVEADRPDDALDSLTDDGILQNPGHGTGTASILASPTAEVNVNDQDIQGVAPGARVRPLRVSTSVVHLSFQNVVLAIEDAIAQQASVVSMSLGGPIPSEALRDVIRRALDAGIIVVSAAGNDLPLVVFPAALPGVVAVAASNAVRIPWRLSGFGDEVVITAPGERVWRAVASQNDSDDNVGPGDGTSFATAAVAGLAALWVSFHGRDTLLDTFGASLLPFAFHLLLRQTADSTPAFVDSGNGGFGAGIANAQALLQAPLPAQATVQTERDAILNRDGGNPLKRLLGQLGALFRVPTRAPNGAPHLAVNAPDTPGTIATDDVRALVTELLGSEPDDPTIVQELTALIASKPTLHYALLGAAQRIDAAAQDEGTPGADGAAPQTDPQHAQAMISLRRQLLQLPLSTALAQRLTAAQTAQVQQLPPSPSVEDVQRRFIPTPPTIRRLRAYAFDPSLATRLDTATVNAVTIPVSFEPDLQPGPVGEYLEVVDVDPATGCAYPPVDLNHPALVAQDGLPQSEGNPQFHQQMVYAVAMKTIHHFQDALGRPIFWSPLRPWRGGNDAAWATPRTGPDGKPDLTDQYIPRLRLYPHALREANAYYSPDKRAILFGYFPAHSDDPGEEYPGGIVFTCLSHDIVAHEMTHAVLDGMHVYFTEPSNPDVFAFHEGFADIVALFQHFTYPEVLRDQIAHTRGDLTGENALGQLARQFGVATGQHHSLRDAIGGIVTPVTATDDATAIMQAPPILPTPAGVAGAGAPPPPPPRRWLRYQPDPFLLPTVQEAHARGSILVAAVFDAFLAIYGQRVADLARIATGGTGVLPAGQISPDLVNRMADEAAKSASHVLQMCMRAIDYVPPVDITFGEFLRALITADADLIPDDDRHYRVAFIDAFRKWGIYPRDVRTLSEESLRWHSPEELYLFPFAAAKPSPRVQRTERELRRAVLAWGPNAERKSVFESIKAVQRLLNGYLRAAGTQESSRSWALAIMPGIDFATGFSVANVRPARRIGPDGQFLTEMIFEVVQPAGNAPAASGGMPLRGGVTVIVSLDDWRVRYVIYKRRVNADGTPNTDRQDRQIAYQEWVAAMGAAASGAAEYLCPAGEHVGGDRTVNREAMRADSCACRTRRQGAGDDGEALAEPFALLHRGRE